MPWFGYPEMATQGNDQPVGSGGQAHSCRAVLSCFTYQWIGEQENLNRKPWCYQISWGFNML